MPITIVTAPSATPDWPALGADVATLLVAGPAVAGAAPGDVVHAAVRREAPRLADHIRDFAPDDVLVVVGAERPWSAARAGHAAHGARRPDPSPEAPRSAAPRSCSIRTSCRSGAPATARG